MGVTPSSQAPSVSSSGSDELDLGPLLQSLRSHWRLISKAAAGTMVASGAYALIQPSLWQGDFQIVVASDEGSSGTLARLAAANPELAGLAGLSGSSGKDSLETEVLILESPSVLKPVYEFARSERLKKGRDVSRLKFSDWAKNVKVDLEKGTSVLNISYTDTDRSLILPVIEKISQQYQDYSGRDRRRRLVNAVDHLQRSSRTLALKADASMRRAQAFALNHDLGLSDGMATPAALGSQGGSTENANAPSASVEVSRLRAQAKVLQTQQQIAQARAAGNRAIYLAPQLPANATLYSQYQTLQARLSDLRSRLLDRDPMVVNLERQRQSLIGTMNQQTIGLLEGELATARASLRASTRPNEVVLEHRQLVQQAVREEKTLADLQLQLQLAQLEQAKQSDPWELISKPTLQDEPVAPKLLQLVLLGLMGGAVAGAGAALVLDRLSGRILTDKQLLELLPAPLLAHITNSNLREQCKLLTKGPLAPWSTVALIPVGLDPDDGLMRAILTELQAQRPTAHLICTIDLERLTDCDQQLLITQLGQATRTGLEHLKEQLALQGRPVLGWLLLSPARGS